MTLPRLTLSICLCLALSACFQTHLGGSTGGTLLTVAPLREPVATIAMARTRTEQFWIDRQGQADWDQRPAILRLLLVGLLTRDELALDPADIDPDSLYVLTASEGVDRDPNSTGRISGSPAVVQGPWHAIVTGRQLIEESMQVSPLTEAIYQQVAGRLAQLDNDDVVDQLHAAARLLVDDVDESGAVDYIDALAFTRSLHADLYRGDIADLDALAAAIRANQPAGSLQSLSAAVFGSHRVVMATNFGDIVIETLNWEAPVTADNFLRYVEDGFYEDTFFHRVVNNFVIQAGVLEYNASDNSLSERAPGETIRNEARWSVSNARGTVAMARTSDPDSASYQFYINQVDNPGLDFGASPDNPAGYAVFARVVSGLNVVDNIAAIPTFALSFRYQQVPQQPAFIESVTIED